MKFVSRQTRRAECELDTEMQKLSKIERQLYGKQVVKQNKKVHRSKEIKKSCYQQGRKHEILYISDKTGLRRLKFRAQHRSLLRELSIHMSHKTSIPSVTKENIKYLLVKQQSVSGDFITVSSPGSPHPWIQHTGAVAIFLPPRSSYPGIEPAGSSKHCRQTVELNREVNIHVIYRSNKHQKLANYSCHKQCKAEDTERDFKGCIFQKMTEIFKFSGCKAS